MNRLPPSQLHLLLEDAIRLESRGDLEEAWKRYRKVVDEDQSNVEGLTLLGKVELRLDDAHAAVFHLLRAARLAPKRPDIHLALGYAWDQAGDRRNAVSSFLTAVEIDQQFAPAYVSLGQIFAAKGQRDLANTAFEFARKAGSVYPEVHYLLGKHYYVQGRAQLALAALMNAQRLGGLHWVTIRILTACWVIFGCALGTQNAHERICNAILAAIRKTQERGLYYLNCISRLAS